MKKTSWDKSAKWYSTIVGRSGHYFHEHIILPNCLRLLQLRGKSRLLDLACGQGILARTIPDNIDYTGIDISPQLISEAEKMDNNPRHRFIQGDITTDLPLPKNSFTHASLVLALQNIEFPQKVFANARKHLTKEGRLLIIINHPYFRIPRQTSWEIDQKSQIQYRRINRYLTPLKIPITTHPGITNSPITWSFHHPLSNYTKWLNQTGFVITNIEEWTSDKISVGKAGKMENFARQEFPLFMAISAVLLPEKLY